LRSGAIAFYWHPPIRVLEAGFPLHQEALGQIYLDAVARADMLNAQLDAWRTGRGTDILPGRSPASAVWVGIRAVPPISSV
jgi:hypothetical protein